MATINSLNVSITQMTFEKALELISNIRKSRKISKKIVKEKKEAKASTEPKVKKASKDPFANLTNDQKLALIKRFGG